MAPPMSVTFLGTGSAYPTPKKAASSMVFRYDGELWMFDCGEGTQTQLMKSDLKAGKITKIFITHLHGDHLYGLPGLLCTISQSNQRLEPVSIYGPLGLAKYLRVTLGLSKSELCFKFRVIEMIPTHDMLNAEHNDMDKCDIDPCNETQLHPCELPGETLEPITRSGVPTWPLIDNDLLTVTAGGLIHRVPSFGFVINERPLAGGIDLEKLRSYGLTPGPICKQLKSGITIETPEGIKISFKDVSKPQMTGRKIVICGDSNDSRKMAPIAQNADVFIHEATLQNSMKEMALERGHSTPVMAAQFALLANADLLYLTHFSQRYTESTSKSMTDFTVNDLKKEAQEVFGENVAVSEDLQTFQIQIKKPSNTVS